MATSAPLARAIGVIITGSLPLLMLGALGASIRADLGLTNAQFGLIFAAFSASSLALATVGGGLSERVGWRSASRLGCWLSAACMAGSALVAADMATLLAFALVGGAGQAVLAPAANLIMATGVGGRGRGTAMGLKQSAVAISGIVAGLAVPALALTLGWRWAIGATGTAALVIGLTIPRTPARGVGQRAHRTNPGRLRAMSSRFPSAPSLLLMGAAGFLGTFAAHAYNAFFVVSSVDGGMSESLAALVFAASGVASLVVRILSGAAADRVAGLARRPLHTAGGLLLFGALGLLLIMHGSPLSTVVGALLACGAGWGWPALYHLAIVTYFEDEPARATGVLRLGLSGGAMLGPLTFGALTTAVGYAAGWLLTVVVAILGALALMCAERPRRQESTADGIH